MAYIYPDDQLSCTGENNVIHPWIIGDVSSMVWYFDGGGQPAVDYYQNSTFTYNTAGPKDIRLGVNNSPETTFSNRYGEWSPFVAIL